MQRNRGKVKTKNIGTENIEIYNQHCCGCGECAVICPVGAITMQQNNQGFYYPFVNKELCVNCRKCINHCAFNNRSLNGCKTDAKEAYALKHKDSEIRSASRSGGMFTALTDLVLDAGGVVYGCTLLKFKDAVHIRATTKSERNSLRGSKYIQSKIVDSFISVKQDLEDGQTVLFSGTACQVNAVKDYCKDINCSNLITVDIVCHGVPSPMVWSDYLEYLSKGKTVVSVDFRDKQRFGWAEHKETVTFSDGSIYSDDIFKQLFYKHYILRRDCFQCPFKSLNRVGDITLADCWGIAKEYPDFDDNKGVSLVLINSDKGKELFSRVEDVEVLKVDIEKLLQPPLRENWPMPQNYSGFWEFYTRHTFKKVVSKFVFNEVKLPTRIIRKIKIQFVRIYKVLKRKLRR